MTEKVFNLLLADDDEDDRIFFQEALAEIPLNTTLRLVKDGEELMHFIRNAEADLPDILFLDLNMPRKNGLQCLQEIKINDKLKHVPVVVISTSFDEKVVENLLHIGARHYIRKPAEFPKLRSVIHDALQSVAFDNREDKKFVLGSE